MSTHVLLLNADYSPIKILSWEKAVCLILDHKVSLVEKYADRMIRSASFEMPWPAVVALKKYVHVAKRVKFNRVNVLARDRYQCMYCGVKPRTSAGNPVLSDLTIEHIVPRAQSVEGRVTLPWNGKNVPVTCWENVVAACESCNLSKGPRTPKEAGMTLMKIPAIPSAWDVLRMTFTRTKTPTEWAEYLPRNSEWRGYWTDELESD